MILWINGPYSVGKTALAETLHARIPDSFLFDAEGVGDAVRDNLPKELYRGPLYESYPLWFQMCAALLGDIAGSYSGTVFVPMTLALPDSFGKIAGPLRKKCVRVEHILLESTYEIVHDRILARGGRRRAAGAWSTFLSAWRGRRRFPT